MTSESSEADRLVEAASLAMSKAHCPYSNFPVGAALLTETGVVFTGCNVENASTPVGICAERTAIVKAVSEGHTSFKSIAVITNKTSINFPCGLCRQSLREFSADLTIYCANKKKEFTTHSLKDLLPHSFNHDDLFGE